MPTRKVILITGASSGNGQAAARLLAQHGYKVFGTSRNVQRAPTAGGNAPSKDMPRGDVRGVAMLPLDVRSDESVTACIEEVLKQAGRIDVLINNAGYELGGALEETSIEEARSQFETNFFGVMRMVNAVLPVMRRQGGGQIINVTSLVGLIPAPFLGVYSASKFALEGYTEVLRHEVKPFNIRVSMVEPGFVKTNIAGNRVYTANQIGDYDTWRRRAFEAIHEYEANGAEPALVAKGILRIVQSASPKLRYRIGKDATSLPRLRRFLPESMFERGVRSHYHLQMDTGR